MDKMQEQKMLAAGIREMVADGGNDEYLTKTSTSNSEIRQLLIDIGILATKSYDSEWLESQRSWLESYKRGN